MDLLFKSSGVLRAKESRWTDTGLIPHTIFFSSNKIDVQLQNKIFGQQKNHIHWS